MVNADGGSSRQTQSPSEQQLPVPSIVLLPALPPLPAAAAPAVAEPALPAALTAMPAAPVELGVMPALPLLAALPALAVWVVGVCVALRPALAPLGAARPACAAGLGALLPDAALGFALLDVGSELDGVVGSAPHAAAAEARNITKRDVRYRFMPAD
ncbi:MAG TPA: hypothetical protein VFN67_24675 [Polyangiales bacterium]|nr:hypothetical protein [Polyangiales bacterium]